MCGKKDIRGETERAQEEKRKPLLCIFSAKQRFFIITYVQNCSFKIINLIFESLEILFIIKKAHYWIFGLLKTGR